MKKGSASQKKVVSTSSQREEANELIARMTDIRLFSDLSNDAIREILSCASSGVRHFGRGEVIVYEGTKARWLVVVLKGRLTVYESAANGTRHPVRVVETGHLFGATLMTSNLEYYPGMAVATVPSEVIFLDMAKIRTLWMDPRYAKLFANLYSIVSNEVHNCWRKMSILSLKKAEDRFMLYLRWRTSEVGECDVVLPFQTSEACAEYLGVTRTALSLAIKRLVQNGEIAHPDRMRFVVLGLL